jgi:S1-C subfamily serine protease
VRTGAIDPDAWPAAAAGQCRARLPDPAMSQLPIIVLRMRYGGVRTDLPAAPVDTADPNPGPAPASRSNWRRWRPRRGPAAIVALLVSIVLATVALWPDSEPTTTPADVNGIVDKKVEEAITALQAQAPASVAVYEAMRLSLVAVHVERGGGGDQPGLGSGVVVNARGEILTSLHVVDGAARITVSFADGTESPATVRSSDPGHDIAVLTPATLPEVVVPAVLGGGAQVGEEAFAIGHPLGLVGSLSTGVISGLNRSFPSPGGRTLEGMIQFDAAVNPGNSGGPLLNRNGQVIGIVTGLANLAGDDHFAGISFAVPIGTAGGAAGAPAR